MATCKLCPCKKNCWDSGACENCVFNKAFSGLDKTAKKIKKENNELKQVPTKIFEELNTSLYKQYINGDMWLMIREDDFNHYKNKYTKKENKDVSSQ